MTKTVGARAFVDTYIGYRIIIDTIMIFVNNQSVAEGRRGSGVLSRGSRREMRNEEREGAKNENKGKEDCVVESFE